MKDLDVSLRPTGLIIACLCSLQGLSGAAGVRRVHSVHRAHGEAWSSTPTLLWRSARPFFVSQALSGAWSAPAGKTVKAKESDRRSEPQVAVKVVHPQAANWREREK